jgi:hypothetical protein
LEWRRAGAGGEPLDLDGVNVALGPDQVVLYTSAYGATTPACRCEELVLAEDGPVSRLGSPATVRPVGSAAGSTPLGAGRVVVAADGAGVERLRRLPRDMALEVALSTREPVEHSLGAHPVLIRDGQRAPLDRSDPMLTDQHPRTIVAWDRSGTRWLAVFDGRQRRGPGPTVDEVLAFLETLAVTDAVMLDGGGSSALVTPLGPLNAPSDGAERPVANALIVAVPADLQADVGAVRAAAPVAPIAVAGPPEDPRLDPPAAPSAVPVPAAVSAPAVVPPTVIAPPVIVPSAAPRSSQTLGCRRGTAARRGDPAQPRPAAPRRAGNGGAGPRGVGRSGGAAVGLGRLGCSRSGCCRSAAGGPLRERAVALTRSGTRQPQ